MKKPKLNYLFCKTCGEQVDVRFLRSHLCTHNPNVDNLSAEEVRDCFQLTDPAGERDES